MFEILTLAAGVGNRLQPFHQGTRHSEHEHSCYLRENCATLSILTPSFYKGRSAFTVTYEVVVTPWLSLQPDFQFIFDPVVSQRDAYVFGLQAVFTL